MSDSRETEIKLRVQDKTAALEYIRTAGFRESVGRLFEANTLYDTPDQRLMKSEMLLRLRRVGEKCVITWKGPGERGPHKSRPEVETTLDSAEKMGRILEEIGFRPAFRYEKYRTEFTRDGAQGVVTLDETPIGDFLELEGAAPWIDETARQLGFREHDYILDSYGKLYLADCERRGVQPTHMVFASAPG
jgi:adenylate cyclase, class 2